MVNQGCKTCNNNFEIRDEDLVFYEQVKTVPPLDCPDCRMAKRLVFRNERSFYKRPCDMCKKDMVTLYSTESPLTVYCHDCWWSDTWDARDFAVEYDPRKTFFEQYKELQLKVPRIGLMAFNNMRSEYTNGSAENKDCYLVFAADYNEDCMYGRLLQRDKQCVDCAFLHESELCYECIDSRNCFRCMFSEQCQNSSDLLFCYNMRDSQNCIFCTNGRHMSNCILNVKYSKEEFEQKKKEILENYESIEEAKRQFAGLKEKAIRKYSNQTKCHNVTGDYLHNCYDGVQLFDTYDSKNCSYMKDTENPTDSMDCNNYYYKCNFGYNVMGALQISNSKNCAFIFYCNDVEYCESCHHLSDAIGCNGIRKGQYMILNKEYSKEEYQKIKSEIVEKLQHEGKAGQFFPPDSAPFGYNETLAQEYIPLTREEAVSRGFHWQEKNSGTFGKETITKANIPKSITTTPDSILSDILACNECGKNFKIVQAELDFYKRMNLPIPHKDFECRHQNRMAQRNPRKLRPRTCMCTEERHVNHTGSACTVNFETGYPQERPEIIYCESCYQQEVA